MLNVQAFPRTMYVMLRDQLLYSEHQLLAERPSIAKKMKLLTAILRRSPKSLNTVYKAKGRSGLHFACAMPHAPTRYFLVSWLLNRGAKVSASWLL